MTAPEPTPQPPIMPMPRLGRGGCWSISLDGAPLPPAEPYDAKAARAGKPRTVMSWPKTGTVGAKSSIDIEPECAQPAETEAPENASPAGSLIADAVLREEPPPPRSPHYHSWFCGCPDAIQRLEEATEPEPAPVVELQPAPPSRRGWFGSFFRRSA